MSKCDLCSNVNDELIKCVTCGTIFCDNCGDMGKCLCEDCIEYDEVSNEVSSLIAELDEI